jgi:tRNA threonylcarbamoyladenosine biosynthesis protein TsaE
MELRYSLETLPELAAKVIELLEFSPVVVFRGEMGAGKTTLIKNMCNLLSVSDSVSSPTFSLVNEYLSDKGQTIYHFDFYRIEEEEEALDMGCEDYFYSGNICLIEWPEKIESLLPEKRIELSISVEGEQRAFTIKKQTNVG